MLLTLREGCVASRGKVCGRCAREGSFRASRQGLGIETIEFVCSSRLVSERERICSRGTLARAECSCQSLRCDARKDRRWRMLSCCTATISRIVAQIYGCLTIRHLDVGTTCSISGLDSSGQGETCRVYAYHHQVPCPF